LDHSKYVSTGTSLPTAAELRTSNTALGDANGYSSLEQAVAAASKLTEWDSNPAAAVLESGNTFFVQGLEQVIHSPGRNWLGRKKDDIHVSPWEFEGRRNYAPNLDLELKVTNDALRAIIDGPFTLPLHHA
jgi:hypothetical protein